MGKRNCFYRTTLILKNLDCILEKCSVHTFQEYKEIEGQHSDSDYYSRFEYDAYNKKLIDVKDADW